MIYVSLSWNWIVMIIENLKLCDVTMYIQEEERRLSIGQALNMVGLSVCFEWMEFLENEGVQNYISLYV